MPSRKIRHGFNSSMMSGRPYGNGNGDKDEGDYIWNDDSFWGGGSKGGGLGNGHQVTGTFYECTNNNTGATWHWYGSGTAANHLCTGGSGPWSCKCSSMDNPYQSL